MHTLKLKLHTLFKILPNNAVIGGKIQIHTKSGELVGEVSERISRSHTPPVRTFTADEPMVVTVAEGESEYELS